MGQLALYKNTVLLHEFKTKYPELYQTLQKRGFLDFSQLKSQSILIGQGCAAKIYLCPRLNVAIKINKTSIDIQRFCREVYFNYKASTVWPGIFDQLVIDKDVVVGFSMTFFHGQKIWQAYCDPVNIYFRSASSRVRLVKKVKEQVKKMQLLQIGHGDLHIDNIMIRQPDLNKEDCEILIIDYGLAFMMDEHTAQKPSLTGWSLMKPAEAKTNFSYNATGLNAYMFGRVALQILMLKKYSDYNHSIDESPATQLLALAKWGFDASVRKEIELYFDNDINVRKTKLLEDSLMHEKVSENAQVKNIGYQQPTNNLKSSALSQQKFKNLAAWDETYYIKHPEQLGYHD